MLYVWPGQEQAESLGVVTSYMFLNQAPAESYKSALKNFLHEAFCRSCLQAPSPSKPQAQLTLGLRGLGLLS